MNPGDLVVPVPPWLMCASWPHDGGRVRWEADDPGLIVCAQALENDTFRGFALVLLGDGRVWQAWISKQEIRVVSCAGERD